MKNNNSFFKNPANVIGIILSFIGLYFAFNDFNFNQFIVSIKKVKLFYLILACILLIFSVLLRAFRWNYLLLNEKNIRYKILFRAEMIGYFANNVLPLRLGELYRAIILSKKVSIPKTTILGSIVIERILDLFGLVIISLFLFLYPVDDSIRKYIYLGVIIAIILGIILLVIKQFFNQNIEVNFLNKFFKGLIGLKKNYIIKTSIITFLLWIIYWINTHLIQHSLDIDMSYLDSLLVLIISSLSLAIPSAPGMIGTFHLAVNYTMEYVLGYSTDISNTFAIILHAYGYITLTIIGAYYFINKEPYKSL